MKIDVKNTPGVSAFVFSSNHPDEILTGKSIFNYTPHTFNCFSFARDAFSLRTMPGAGALVRVCAIRLAA